MIVEEIEYDNKDIYVIGLTGVGRLSGLWRHKELPIEGMEYSIELDISVLDRDEILIIPEESYETQFERDEKVVLFKGVCEDIDEIYVIRFAIDWIEMIDVQNDDYSIERGDTISFRISSSRIGIYPY